MFLIKRQLLIVYPFFSSIFLSTLHWMRFSTLSLLIRPLGLQYWHSPFFKWSSRLFYNFLRALRVFSRSWSYSMLKIFLLNTNYNIYTAILQPGLANVLDKHVQTTQYGFRRKKSTAQAVHYVRRVKGKEKRRKRKPYLFNRLGKAFD